MADLGKDYIYIHSRCCNEHWELAWNKTKKKYELVCCKCGNSAGPFKIEGPDLTGQECECCTPPTIH